jgi:hypothetical protein
MLDQQARALLDYVAPNDLILMDTRGSAATAAPRP